MFIRHKFSGRFFIIDTDFPPDKQFLEKFERVDILSCRKREAKTRAVYYVQKNAEKHGTIAALWGTEAAIEGSCAKRWAEEVQEKLLAVGINKQIQTFLMGVNLLCKGVISHNIKNFENGLIEFCEKSGIAENSEKWVEIQLEKYRYQKRFYDFESAVRYTMQTVQGMLNELPENLQVYFQENKAEIFKGLCEIFRTE